MRIKNWSDWIIIVLVQNWVPKLKIGPALVQTRPSWPPKCKQNNKTVSNPVQRTKHRRSLLSWPTSASPSSTSAWSGILKRSVWFGSRLSHPPSTLPEASEISRQTLNKSLVMEFYDFVELASSGEEECKNFLQANGLIRSTAPACPAPACIAVNGRMVLAANRPGRKELLRWK